MAEFETQLQKKITDEIHPHVKTSLKDLETKLKERINEQKEKTEGYNLARVSDHRDLQDLHTALKKQHAKLKTKVDKFDLKFEEVKDHIDDLNDKLEEGGMNIFSS